MTRARFVTIAVAVLLLLSGGIASAMDMVNLAASLATDIPGEVSVVGSYIPEYGAVYLVQSGKSASVGLQIAQMYPELSLYYYWNLHAHEFLDEKQYITLVFRTNPEIQVTAQNTGFTGEEFHLDNMRHVNLRVNGKIVVPSNEALAKSIEQLVSNGRRWISEFDPNQKTFFGGYSKDKPEYLDEAEHFLRICLAIDKNNETAKMLMDQVHSLRAAYQGYEEASEILKNHERALSTAVKNEDKEMIAAHSFQLWNAYDILTSVLTYNPNHDRARESYSKLSATLSTHPRLTHQELIALQGAMEQEYKNETKTIAYSVLERDARDLKGERVTYRGRVVQSTIRSDKTVLRIDVGSGNVVWAEIPSNQSIYVDDRIVIWGEVDGIETYRSIAGWRISVPRVRVRYFSLMD